MVAIAPETMSPLAQQVDWDAVRDEVTGYLQALIRLETVNPPGNEKLVADYLRELLEAEGFDVETRAQVENRDNLTTRLSGSGEGGRPMLLMAHSDVVSVEADKWTYPPFGGEIHDGMIYGRGAIDMKHTLSSELMIMLLVKRMGLQLNRDLIMGIFADEEAGSRAGAHFMWDNHRELIDAEVAICEGGGPAMDLLGQRFYTCRTGEKGGAAVRIIARAAPGHASVPRDDTAMLRMGRALEKISTTIFPTHMTASVERMLRTMQVALGDDAAEIIDVILQDPTWENLQRLPLSEKDLIRLRAMTRTSAVPTIIHGGHRRNVIPGEVICDVDVRILPGQEPAQVRQQIADLLGPDVIVEAAGPGRSGIESDPESDLFDVLGEVMGRLDPGSVVMPTIMTGGSDAKAVPGIKVYGFVPAVLSAEERDGAHNHNECISIDNLLYQTQALFEVVLRYCDAQPAA